MQSNSEKEQIKKPQQQSEKSKKMWGKLKQLLLKDKKFKVQDKIHFDLLQKTQLNNQNKIQYDYMIDQNNSENSQNKISVQITQMNQELSLNDVKKYNSEKVDSTGISLWPSEEVLAYYCIKNIENFKNKSIIELGAGYSGLAGLLLAKYLVEIEKQEEINIKITDGQEDCSLILKENAQQNNIQKIQNDSKINIQGEQLIWSENFSSEDKYDRIIIADCLFFKNYHQALVNTLQNLINPTNGEIIIIGPQRGNTMSLFLEKASQVFTVEFSDFKDQKYQEQLLIQQKLDGYEEDKNLIKFLTLKLKQ